ncbi:MAG: hypothetical protein OXO52_00375 [Rhodospirillales bacterium]|nr:hypothetical protein [Rhodospirillales bacterium]MDE0382048.1 hypothetical protein [Rhodospirillales bacterium]
MPIAEAEQNRAVLAIANAGDDFLALATADPTAAGNNLIAAAGRAEINLGRENADPAGEVKNLAAVDFQPTGLVQNATHFAIMTAAAGGSVRAWGRLVDAGNNPATVSQQSTDDILRVAAGAVVVRIPAGAI